ncbi:MAG: hypothetical protein HRF51_11820 [bacterium]|jgi:hypothetical protein
MFCPKCRYEYEIGLFVCPDCGSRLVETLPPDEEPEYTELVTVLTTGDAGLLALAKSILNDAAIDFYVKGESAKDLFAAGFYEVQVNPENEEEALGLMEDMLKGGYTLAGEDYDDEDVEDEEER